MKTALKAIVLLGIVAYLVWAVLQYARPSEQQVCSGVRVSMSDSTADSPVDEDYVHGILYRRHLSPKGVCLADISLLQLDSVLTADPYISQASCHFTSTGLLCIDVTVQKPILHVMQSDGDEYYMTQDGVVMPVRASQQGLCLVTGQMNRVFVQKKLLPLARYIYESEFWNDQIEQVYVSSSHQVELVPRVGDHVVQLGTVDGFKDKLHRLHFFYKHGMPQVGWNKYKTINLAYDGQIVCTK